MNCLRKKEKSIKNDENLKETRKRTGLDLDTILKSEAFIKISSNIGYDIGNDFIGYKLEVSEKNSKDKKH